jgi:hypothetical protein
VSEFERMLDFALLLARRWGRLNIPDGQHVMITGFVFVEDAVAQSGVALMEPRVADDDPHDLTIASNTWMNCSAVGLVDTLIDLANEAVTDG